MSMALQESSVSVSHGLDVALDALSAALDAGQAGELWQVPDRELAAGAVRCGRLVSRATALLTRLVWEVDASEGWRSAPVRVRRRRGRGTN